MRLEILPLSHLIMNKYVKYIDLAFTHFNLVICNARESMEQLVESVLNKVVEEFEHCIVSEGEQVEYHFTLLIYNVLVFR